MSYKSLNHFINKLESEGELIRVNAYVSPYLEIAEIADRFIKNNKKALLFENTGTDFPLLINAFGSEKRMSMALQAESLDSIGEELLEIISAFSTPKNTLADKLRMLPLIKEFASWMPKTKKGKGKCQEIVMNKPDIKLLPVLTSRYRDGGPFITLPIVNTIDPVTKIRNVGMYRMQVFDKTLTAMHWHLHKNSARHYQEYKRLNMKMPVSVVLGGDPVYTYCATAPLPDNVDEYMLAGFLRKKKVNLVKCLTNDIYVPEDADFVIEGYIDPNEELILEGPFGDHTGFYSLADYYPRFHITCITHRKNAVYPATIVGIPPMEDAFLGKATERIFINLIKFTLLPEIIDMHMPVEGVFHNIVIVKINKTYAGQGVKVMNALWGAGQMMFNKIMIVVSEDIDITNYNKLTDIVLKNTHPLHDIHFSKGPVDILDHSSVKFAYGGKFGIDATIKFESEIVNDNNSTFYEEEVKFNTLNIEDIIAYKDLSVSEKQLIIIFIKKVQKNQCRDIAKKLAELNNKLNGFVVFADDKLVNACESDLVWYLANNIDPQRDCFYITDKESKTINCLFIDGTRKTQKFDDFQRQWPNVVVTDDETIEMVDKKWDNYNIGEFITSPSSKYKDYLYGNEAIAEE
jgi:4-hydroxy-3-polyprenylbenzoate decarboxylase